MSYQRSGGVCTQGEKPNHQKLQGKLNVIAVRYISIVHIV